MLFEISKMSSSFEEVLIRASTLALFFVMTYTLPFFYIFLFTSVGKRTPYPNFLGNNSV